MRKTLLIAALSTLVAGHANAADDYVVRDLWFFGKKGTISGSFAPQYTQDSTKVESIAGTSDSKEIVLPYEIYYSLCDHLKLGVAPTFTYTDPEGASTKSGFSEPSFIAVWRALAQNERFGFLDVTFNISPTWGEAKQDSQFRGGTALSIGFSLGKSYEKFAYKVTPTFGYTTVQHIEKGSDKDARFDWAIAGETQYNINDKFSLLANLLFAMPGDSKDAFTKAETDFLILVSPGVKYAVMDELALSLLANYSYTKGSVTNPVFTGSKDITSNAYGATLKVAFGF